MAKWTLEDCISAIHGECIGSCNPVPLKEVQQELAELRRWKAAGEWLEGRIGTAIFSQEFYDDLDSGKPLLEILEAAMGEEK